MAGPPPGLARRQAGRATAAERSAAAGRPAETDRSDPTTAEARPAAASGSYPGAAENDERAWEAGPSEYAGGSKKTPKARGLDPPEPWLLASSTPEEPMRVMNRKPTRHGRKRVPYSNSPS